MTGIRRVFFGAVAGVLAWGLAPADPGLAEFDPQVTEKSLDNGAEVLLVPIPGSQVVSVQVWYHVGSKNEVVGKRGLAHMFEHLMFKGTETVGPEEHARRINAVGGSINAFTTDDVTAYFETVPQQHMELALELEADRMENLKVTAKTLRSEREVVKEEKRLRYDNSPVGTALLELRDAAYEKHPYRWTPIGTLEDLDTVTVEDARDFYEKWYTPNNATIIVAGAIETEPAFQAVKKFFGPIPKGPDADRDLPEEPPQKKMREVTIEKPAKLPAILGGYHVPPVAHDDVPVIEVINKILSDGNSSRLHRQLVRDAGIAVQAGGFTWTLEDPGLFVVYAMYLPHVDAAKVRETLLAEVARIGDEGVAEGELEKAKNQLAADYTFSLETAGGLARKLGRAELIEGGFESFLEGPKRYLDITVEDVQRVARTYLTRENLTLVTLLPEGEK